MTRFSWHCPWHRKAMPRDSQGHSLISQPSPNSLEIAGFSRWPGQDSNLRSTDYESVGQHAHLQRFMPLVVETVESF